MKQVNRIFAPTPKEVAHYRRVLEAFEAALARGPAPSIVDGKPVDSAQAANARRVLAWAEGLEAKG